MWTYCVYLCFYIKPYLQWCTLWGRSAFRGCWEWVICSQNTHFFKVASFRRALFFYFYAKHIALQDLPMNWNHTFLLDSGLLWLIWERLASCKTSAVCYQKSSIAIIFWSECRSFQGCFRRETRTSTHHCEASWALWVCYGSGKCSREVIIQTSQQYSVCSSSG